MYLEFDKKVEEALNGDVLAKEWIIHQLKPLVVSYSRKYGGQTGWDEDLYQEGFWQILESLNIYDPTKGVPFLGFVAIRLKHHYQNKRRREKTTISLDKSVGSDESRSMLDLLVDEAVPIEQRYIKKEEHEQLREAITMLDSRDREIIEKYYLKGIKLKEIAKERNVHYVTVAKGRAKAIDNLRKNFIKLC